MYTWKDATLRELADLVGLRFIFQVMLAINKKLTIATYILSHYICELRDEERTVYTIEI